MKKISLIKNALLMPLAGTMDSFTSGVFTSEGQFVENSLLCRGAPAQTQPPAHTLKGEYFFGGYLFWHYGHFLLETLSRVYAILQCRRNIPILFMSPNDAVHRCHHEIFLFLGIKNDILLIKEPTRVESLIYSQPGNSIAVSDMIPEQVAALGKVGLSASSPNKKIWLSRSHFGGGGIVNEIMLELELIKKGWEIVRPESLPLIEQVSYLSTAQYVAGFDGSAFLTALFCKKIHGKYFMFSRRDGIPSPLFNALTVKNIPFEQRTFPVTHVEGEGAASRFYMPNITQIATILCELP